MCEDCQQHDNIIPCDPVVPQGATSHGSTKTASSMEHRPLQPYTVRRTVPMTVPEILYQKIAKSLYL